MKQRSAVLDQSPTSEQPMLRPADRVAAALLPSLGDLLFGCALLGGLLVFQGRALGTDGDIGWSVRLGLITLAHGLPRTEPLLATLQGQPAVHWEWLAQAAYAAAYLLGGLNGVVALAATIIAATDAALYAVLRRHGTPALLALVLALAALGIMSIDWTARAQLFSFPLTLLWVEALWRYWRRGARRWLLAFPALTALWANLHAGFLGGFLLLGVAILIAWLFPSRRGQARPRDLSAALVASFAATLCTPWGWGLLQHLWTYARNPLVAAHTQEYQSPDFHLGAPRLFLALFATLIAIWLYAARRRELDAFPEPLALALVTTWTLLSLTYVRFLPLWPLIALPALGETLGKLWPTPTDAPDALDASDAPRHAGASWARCVGKGMFHLASRVEQTDRLVGRGIWSAVALLVVLVVLVNGGALPGQRQPVLHASFDARVFPVAAVQELKTQGLPPGPGFNTYEWGGYLDYALPQYHVFIDSRSDVYAQQFLSDYATIVGVQPGWQRLLAKYGIQWALLPAREPLAQVLALAPGWRCQPEDTTHVAVLCVRKTAATASQTSSVTPSPLIRLREGELVALTKENQA